MKVWPREMKHKIWQNERGGVPHLFNPFLAPGVLIQAHQNHSLHAGPEWVKQLIDGAS